MEAENIFIGDDPAYRDVNSWETLQGENAELRAKNAKLTRDLDAALSGFTNGVTRASRAERVVTDAVRRGAAGFKVDYGPQDNESIEEAIVCEVMLALGKAGHL